MFFFVVRGGLLPYAQTKLVSPSGRDVAQRQRGQESADIAFQICPDTNLSACCPLSHLLRKCQLSQRESREAGADCTHAASGELLRRPARVLLLPSRLAPCHLPQGGRLWVSAQPKLVSSLGRDVAQRQRGLILLHASGCLAVSPTSQNTVRNTAAMSAESVMPL